MSDAKDRLVKALNEHGRLRDMTSEEILNEVRRGVVVELHSMLGDVRKERDIAKRSLALSNLARTERLLSEETGAKGNDVTVVIEGFEDENAAPGLPEPPAT